MRESAGGEGRHHRRLRGTQAAVVSSRTAVPSRRGRPPTPPRNSVVNPTQPPLQVSVRREPGEHPRGRGTGASAGSSEPGTARPPAGFCDQAAPTGTDQKAGTGTTMIRTGGCPWLPRQPRTPATADHAHQDRVYRLPMAVTTAIANRYFGSCPRPPLAPGKSTEHPAEPRHRPARHLIPDRLRPLISSDSLV